ncbi:MAG TPA: ATP-binding protein [Pirellulaceae bacterium]|jgi:signal transduction histidine kinase
MWRQIALPVIGVALSWLAVSGSTNFYLQWLDDSYQQVFDENIASMHAASIMQQEIWQLHAELLAKWDRDIDLSQRLDTFDEETQYSLKTLVERATTDRERDAAALIAKLAREYRSVAQNVEKPESRRASRGMPIQDQLFGLAAKMSEQTDVIRQINDELLRAHNARRTRISQAVLWARGLAITLVPALGIVLGWWTAARVQKTVARIQVTLHDPLLSTPGDLGTVQVRGGNELASIQQQVEVVVDRLRRTGNDLQAARQEVLRAERLAAIGGLAAGVAHELRNPLTSVKLLLQHAGSRAGNAIVEGKKLALILEEIERMETTIQGLLDFSRPAQPHRKLHDVRETVERAMHLIEGRAQRQHVSTELDLGDNQLMINGDPQQLQQVFINLMINAVEAMPRGGVLRVAAKKQEFRPCVALQIFDTGEGIPPELLGRLFEPFATAKERGTGLGLAVSRRILEEHDGTIDVHPQSPRGTMFEVTLRLVASHKPAIAAVM